MQNNGESIIHGNATISEGRRIILMTNKACLKRLARAKSFCANGTFKITPAPWGQVMIISAEATEGTWVPVAFGLLPDKKL